MQDCVEATKKNKIKKIENNLNHVSARDAQKKCRKKTLNTPNKRYKTKRKPTNSNRSTKQKTKHQKTCTHQTNKELKKNLQTT